MARRLKHSILILDIHKIFRNAHLTIQVQLYILNHDKIASMTFLLSQHNQTEIETNELN